MTGTTCPVNASPSQKDFQPELYIPEEKSAIRIWNIKKLFIVLLWSLTVDHSAMWQSLVKVRGPSLPMSHKIEQH